MRVLYGVQATGNGHITRARCMSRELQKAGIDADYIFSGRSPDKLFDMEPFGDFRCFRGLTFATRKGKIQRLKTVTGNNIFQFIKDVASLDLSPYDLVITDFEPVTAWAAILRNKPSVAIGHQYAFQYKIPTPSGDPIARFIVRKFAPARQSFGIHWHHFDSPILPPMIEPASSLPVATPGKILVYLSFFEVEEVVKKLPGIAGIHFRVYCDIPQARTIGNIQLLPFSRAGFLEDLQTCAGLVTTAGFELICEAMQLGKKILAIPLHGQMEQVANAMALQELKIADVIERLDTDQLIAWLSKRGGISQHRFPNVAEALAEWMHSGMKESALSLSKTLWSQVA